MKKLVLLGAFLAFGAMGAMAQTESVQVTSFSPNGAVETRTEQAPAKSEGTVQKAAEHKSGRGMMGGCGSMSTNGKSAGCCSSKGAGKSSCGDKKK